ncbi:MAG: pectate lyase [Candidatus Ratteibacteria bacterium]|nr:pectate lyase [Candidatus Ratteibacteria bacterium]
MQKFTKTKIKISFLISFCLFFGGYYQSFPQNIKFEDTLIGFASCGSGTTGGKGGDTITASNAEDFLKYIAQDKPYMILVFGNINLPKKMHRVKSDKTIMGIGSAAKLRFGGLNLSGVSNIIIKNISFEDAVDDSINIEKDSNHIWIDHCTFSNGRDGLIDIKRRASYITISWNKFSSHQKTSLVGHSDNYKEDIGFLKVTFHHNWFNGTKERHPRIRFGEVHVFNNYYTNNNYGVASTCNAKVLVENNYFANVKNPTVTGYLSSPEGNLEEKNNVFLNSGPVQTKGIVFDPSEYYDYTPDNAVDVPKIVREGAGAGRL